MLLSLVRKAWCTCAFLNYFRETNGQSRYEPSFKRIDIVVILCNIEFHGINLVMICLIIIIIIIIFILLLLLLLLLLLSLVVVAVAVAVVVVIFISSSSIQ